MTSDKPLNVSEIGRDPEAFTAFYLSQLELVQRFVARRVADPYLAADLTADVFLAVIKGAGSYRADLGPPEAWLTGVARNVVNTELRRLTRERDLTRRVAGRRVLEHDALAAIEERIDAERVSRRMYEALSSLSNRDRALMELVAVDGLPVAEAAALLGMKPGTARVRLHRSRARVQSLLPPEAALLMEVPL